MFSIIGRLNDALIDPLRRERVVLVVLAVYAALWTLYGIIARRGLDFHFDMLEQIAWSRNPAFGYLKHPPLAAVLVRLWFDIFPIAHWSYYFLAILVAVVALWIIWRLMADYLDAEKRVVGLALITLVPFFNFHALKYNVNTILMPLWAATTFLFLRSFKTHSLIYAALAGVGAAACMLGKYWSIFLLLGLVLAVLLDHRRAAYFRTAAPWLTVGVGLILLGPHYAWLVKNHFAPFEYAISEHGNIPLKASAISAVRYLIGAAAYTAFPVILVLIAARPRYATLIDMIWPKSCDRRFMAIAFWVPILSPIVVALVGDIELHALWTMSAWALWPQMMLSSPSVVVSRIDTRNILACAVALPLLALASAPIVNFSDLVETGTHTRLLSGRVQRAWTETTKQPLRFVGGDPNLAYGVALYSPDRPQPLPGLPLRDELELRHNGAVFVCYAENHGCVENAVRFIPNSSSSHFEVDIVRKHLGYEGPTRRYGIVIVPPQP